MAKLRIYINMRINNKKLSGSIKYIRKAGLSSIFFVATIIAMMALNPQVEGVSISLQPRLKIQTGHAGAVIAVAFSPDGRYVLTGGHDAIACLWDIQTGREIQSFIGHDKGIAAISFSPDGRYVLTGGYDKTVRLWETATGHEVRRFDGHSDSINDVKFSPDGVYVLTASADATTRLWNLATGREMRRFEGDTRNFFAISFSPDGHYMMTGEWEKVRVWNISTGLEFHRLTGFQGPVSSVAFSADGRYVLTGALKIAQIWNTTTWREERRFGKPLSKVHSVAFSRDGRFALISSAMGLHVWDIETKQEIRRFGNTATSIDISPDGHYVLTDGYKKAHLWELATGKEVRIFTGQSDMIEAVNISSDDRYIIVGGQDQIAHLWELTTGREIQRFTGHDVGPITDLAISKDSQFVLTGGDKTARLWELTTGRELVSFKGHMSRINSVKISSKVRYVLTGSWDHTARLWELTTGREILRFMNVQLIPDSGPIIINRTAAYFSQDDSYVFTLSDDNIIRQWDIDTGSELMHFDGNAHNIQLISISHDGRHLLTRSTDNVPHLVEFPSGIELLRLDGKILGLGSKSSSAFSPNDRYVLLRTDNNNVGLWDLKNGRKLKQFEGHTNFISSFAFSSDSRFVITGSRDQTVRIWSTEEDGERARLVSFTDGTWIVTTPEGRFDSNNLEEIKGLHWIIPDDPMKPIPIEIFMRNYYEPQLLTKVISGKQFKPIRLLSDLNLVQPEIKILLVEKGFRPDIAKVTVEVNTPEGTFQTKGEKMVMKDGVYDLRLFRDGQLIGQYPEPTEETYKSIDITSPEEVQSWRKATEVKLEKNGKTIKTFTVRLPRRKELKEVDFTAYAFNEDRVKSETARYKYILPEKLTPVKGRAYIIAVGVTDNKNLYWRLDAAAEDAKLIQKSISDNIKKIGDYEIEEVVTIPLITMPMITDFDDEKILKERETFISPTKENIKTILDILAGRNVDPVRMEHIPSELKNDLRQVQPEDMVVISFSSHGIMDANGEFYILPYDLGEESGGEITPEILKHSISSQELSLWLSPMEAEQMFMIIDACHSAAAVDVEGFKPGPMGNPGLGQLSYDKKMPILTASQATDSAWAQGYSLLTYALAKEGIEENKASRNGQMTLIDALKYAEARVPKLFEERMGKEKKVQVPKLFEFKREKARPQKY